MDESHGIRQPLYRGAFFQCLFRWIHYCHSSKSTGKKTGKKHLCALSQEIFKISQEILWTSWFLPDLCLSFLWELKYLFTFCPSLAPVAADCWIKQIKFLRKYAIINVWHRNERQRHGRNKDGHKISSETLNKCLSDSVWFTNSYYF